MVAKKYAIIKSSHGMHISSANGLLRRKVTSINLPKYSSFVSLDESMDFHHRRRDVIAASSKRNDGPLLSQSKTSRHTCMEPYWSPWTTGTSFQWMAAHQWSCKLPWGQVPDLPLGKLCCKCLNENMCVRSTLHHYKMLPVVIILAGTSHGYNT